MEKFDLPLEIRTVTLEGKKLRHVIKGYAMVSNLPHVYKTISDGKNTTSFKSLFTDNAKKSMYRQLKHKNVFADVMHDLANSMNVKNLLKRIKEKSQVDIEPEAKAIEDNVSFINEQYPVIKVSNFDIDDKGILVEMETNPYFRSLNKNCELIYDFITNSLEEGFYNGMSINFNPTKVERINGIDAIDDLDIYGISLVGNAALGEDSGIFNVAVRSIQNFRTMELRSMENEKDEKIKVVVEKDDVERLRKEIEEMKKIREDEQKEKIVAEKKRYDEDMEKLKSELEDKKKEIEQAKQQMSKPQPQQSVVMTYDKYKTEYGKTPIDTIREQLPNLSLGELIVLQAEYDTNRALPESTRRLLMNQPPKEMGVEVQAKNKIGG